MQTATNPQTGERVVLINGQWLPFTQSATDDKGQKAFLSNGQWIVAPDIAQPLQAPESFSTLRQILKHMMLGFGLTKIILATEQSL